MIVNVRAYYTYRGLRGIGRGVIIPIVVLFFLERSLTLLEFTVLWSTMNASQFAFEVPTGIVADRFSRKWSMAIGCLLEVVAMLMALATTNSVLLILAFVIWGLGLAFESGASSALLYDSHKLHQKEEEFQKTMGNAISLGLLGMVAGSVLAAITIQHTGLTGPWWIAVAAFAMATVLSVQFHEPPFTRTEEAAKTSPSLKGHVLSYLSHLRASFHVIGRNWELMALVFISVVVGRFMILIERPFAQPYLVSLGFQAEQISYFHTVFFIVTALFARYSYRIRAIVSDKERVSLALISLSLVLLLSIMVNVRIGPVVVVSLIFIYMMKGLFEPLIEDSLNRRVASEKRASCLSIAQMGNSLLGFALGPLFGYLAMALSLEASLEVFQWTFAGLLLVGMVWGWRALGSLRSVESVAAPA